MASVVKLFDKAYALHQQGDISAAILAYQKLLKKKPNHGDANYLVGTLLATQGEDKQALQYLQRAATLMPDSAMVKTNIGLLQKNNGQLAEAEKSFRTALRLQSNLPEALNNLSALLIAKGAPVEAELLARRCMIQGGSHMNYASIQCANALADQGRVEESIELLKQLAERDAHNTTAWDNYLSFLPYSDKFDAAEIYQQHCRWSKTVDQPQNNSTLHTVDNPIKIGYFSPDFSNHPVGYLMQPLLECHDKSKVDVYIYHDSSIHDQQTTLLQGNGHHWREVVGLDDIACHRLIKDDGIDILVDLTGHLANNRISLFAKRAAPIQASYLGYCTTTGLDNIDYVITDSAFDPPGEEAFYSEKLLRLERLAFAVQPSSEFPTALDIRSDAFTFGSFNTLRKLNSKVLALWIEILKQSTDSKLIIQAQGLAEPAMTKQLVDRFTSAGVDASRVELHGFSDYKGHLQLISECDLTLDPWPWNGHMTTLNTLWMGVPMLTLRGTRRSGRMGAAILNELGMDEFIADSEEAYLQKATAFSQQRESLLEARSGLRKRIVDSSLMNGKTLAEAMEQVFQAMLQAS